jgi:hypothetical protein
MVLLSMVLSPTPELTVVLPLVLLAALVTLAVWLLRHPM